MTILGGKENDKMFSTLSLKRLGNMIILEFYLKMFNG